MVLVIENNEVDESFMYSDSEPDGWSKALAHGLSIANEKFESCNVSFNTIDGVYEYQNSEHYYYEGHSTKISVTKHKTKWEI